MLKVSGESLKGNKEFGFDDSIIKPLVDQVSQVMKNKNEFPKRCRFISY